MLYISRIRLVDIRCFAGETVISLPEPGSDVPSWTLVLGDNGTGKTSLLRAIALCLADETSASGLLTELSGQFIHEGRTEGTIELTLRSRSAPSETYSVVTTLTKTESGEDIQQNTSSGDRIPRERLFACAYGAAFGTVGSEVYERYRLIDAVYSLFNYNARLWNPESALYRISRDGTSVESLLQMIDRILMLPEGSTRLGSSGLRLSGPWGSYGDVPILVEIGGGSEIW